MRNVLVLLVFVVRLVNCSFIAFSDNDKLQSMERNRAKSEFYDKHLGKPKKFHKSLQASLKEIVTEKQKKRCEACRESIRCKTQGKCDLCIRFCKDLEDTTLPPPTYAPLLGSIQFYMSEDNAATEPTLGELAPFERLNRYYTVGAFGPGPKQNLLMRLLNLPQRDNVEKLVVLAKPEGGIDDPDHPIIIDTANVFQDEEDGMEFDPEVHTVHGNRILRQMDLDLTSKIDNELNMAVQKKKKASGDPHLTNQEVNEIISKALSTFTPSHLPKLPEEAAEGNSGISIMGMPHITTKRSVASWEASKNVEEPILGARSSFISDSDKETLSPQVESNHIQAENVSHISQNTHLSKETSTEQEIQPDGETPKTQDESSYKGDSHLAKDLYTDDVLNANDDKNLAQLKPAPPTNIEETEQLESDQSEFKQTTASIDANIFTTPSPQTVSQRPTLQQTPEMLSVTIANIRKPESASMVLGNPAEHEAQQLSRQQTNFAPAIHFSEPTEDIDFLYEDPNGDNEDDYEEDVVLMLTPPSENRKNLDSYNSLGTNTDLQNDNSSMYDNNSSDPVVGSWITDEWDKAKTWWHSHVGMEEPSNSTDSVENRELQENHTNGNLRQTESKSHLINANHFTLILKNLEKKVENIADLVEKTCGKHHSEEETVGLETPTFIKKKQQEMAAVKESNTETNSKQRAMGENQIQIVEFPEDQTPDKETTTVAYTEDISPSGVKRPSLLDVALENLHKGTDMLIDKTMDIAQKLHEDVHIPKLTQNKPLSQTKEEIVGAANMDRGLFPTDDTTVACSIEDTGEHVAKPPPETNKDIEKQDTTTECSKETEENISEKLQNKNVSLDARLGSKQDEAFTETPVKTKSEEDVACSYEDSNEYVSKKKHAQLEKAKKAKEQQRPLGQKIEAEVPEQIQEHKETSKADHKFNAAKPSNEEAVACSQESDENVGNAKEQQNEDELPESKSNLNLPSEKPVQPTKDKITEDSENKTDGEVAKEKSSKISQNEEKVGCSEELNGDYVGRRKNEENEENKNLPQSPILPTHEQLPHQSLLDKLLQRENAPFSMRRPPQQLQQPQEIQQPEQVEQPQQLEQPRQLQQPQQIHQPQQNDKNSLPKGLRLFNQNRLHNAPVPARRFNLGNIVKPGAPVHRQSSSNISSETHSIVSKPDTSDITPHVRPLHANDLFPLGFRGPVKNVQPEVVKSQENAAHELAEPVHQRHPFNLHSLDNISPAHKNAQFINPAAPVRQHSGKTLLPALSQRFAEHKRVGSDGFHVHRPQNVENWPQLPNKNDVVGSKQNAMEVDNTGREISSQNPFSIFGKVIPQLNNTELSLHNIPSNKIYFVGTGMQLPLNMKKHNDGSYQLSVDIDKLCNNCNGKSCNKNSENENVNAAKSQDDVVGLPPPKIEVNKSNDVQNNTTLSKARKLEQHLQHSANEEQQSDDKELIPQKRDTAKTEALKFRNKRITNSENITHSESNHTESQTNKQSLSADMQISLPTTQPTYQQLVDSNLSNKSKHSAISKRSPKLGLDFSSMLNSDQTANEDNQELKNEIPRHNTLQIDNLDKSLKKIDHNMKRYYNRRQKLEDHYKEQNRQDLEKPDAKKDVVKRRVTLINNVLTWMKSIAVQDAQTN